MRTPFKYEIRFPEAAWLDISGIVDSRMTELSVSVCTTEYKSAIDTAVFTIKTPANSGRAALRAVVVEGLREAASDPSAVVAVRIHVDGALRFTGRVALDDMDFTQTRLPGDISLSCEDWSTTFLDEPPSEWLVLEDKSVGEVVTAIIAAAGGELSSPVALVGQDDVTLKAFTASPDEEDTWRDYIDTLLFESGGYVLNCRADGKLEVIRIPWDEYTAVRQVTNYLVPEGVSTSITAAETDGVKVQWSELGDTAEELGGEKQTVYVADIDDGVDDEGRYTGYGMEPGAYWPEGGGEEMTWLEYEADFLDREYQSKQKRKVNKDLSIILASNPVLSAAVWDGEGGQVAVDDAFDHPVLTDIGMTANPVWNPDKALVLLRNKTEGALQLTALSIEADVVYRKKNSTLTLPALCRKPEEYESLYLYSQARAERFASFYHHFKRHARTVYQWSEMGEGELGEVVSVPNKDTRDAQAAFVVQVTYTWEADTPKSSFYSVALGEYGEYEASNSSSIGGGSSSDSVTAVVDYYLASDLSSGVMVNTPGWTTNPDYAASSAGRYLWKHTRTVFSSGRVSVSAPLIVAIKGEDEAVVTLTAAKTMFRYFADNLPTDEDEEGGIVVTASQANIGKQIVLSWAGGSHTLPSTGGSYSIPISALTAQDDALEITASCDVFSASVTVNKQMMQGSLALSVSKDYFQFYADDFPHDDADSITAIVTSRGYKTEPALKVGGQQVAMTGGQYAIPVSAMTGATLMVEANVGEWESVSSQIRKVMDVGVFQLLMSGAQFIYTADNWPVDEAASIRISVVKDGYKSDPVLKVGGAVVELSESLAHDVPALAMLDFNKLAVEATLAGASRTSEITKVRNSASVSLALSAGMFTFYADNVPLDADDTVRATVFQTGLHFGVKLTAGGAEYALDASGGCDIPVSVLEGAADSVSVKAFSTVLGDAVSDTRLIVKSKLSPDLELLTDTSSFSFDKNGAASPAAAVITYRTSGLSDAVVPTLKIQNAAKEWADGKYVLAAVETLEYSYVRVVAEIQGFSLVREVIISKVTSGQDGVIPIYLYQYGPSPTVPPEGVFLTYGEFALAYGDSPLSWGAGGEWSGTIPETHPEGSPYLWVKVSIDNGETWQTYCAVTQGPQGPQGPQGQPGKDGEDGKDGKGAVYCGALSAPPAMRPDGTAVAEGDYYLNTSDAVNPLPYIMQSNGVWRLVTSSDTQWAAIASATAADVAALGGSLLVTNSYYGYFSLLQAVQANFDVLGTKRMVIKPGGEIVAQAYIDTGGVEGYRITDEAIYANRGEWNAGINSGTLVCIPNSKLPDGRDAFDFRADTSLGEYWSRFKALRLNSGDYLHVPEEFDRYWQGMREGVFSPVIGDYDGSFTRTAAVSGMFAEYELNSIMLNGRWMLTYHDQRLSGGQVEWEAGFWLTDIAKGTDNNFSNMYTQNDLGTLGVNFVGMVADEVQGKVFILSRGTDTSGLRLFSFAIQDEYAAFPELAEETVSAPSEISGRALHSIVCGPKAYGASGVSFACMAVLYPLAEGGTESHAAILDIDFGGKAVTYVERVADDVDDLTIEKDFVHSVCLAGGVAYALVAVPSKGLCLSRYAGNGREDLKILATEYENAWSRLPYRIGGGGANYAMLYTGLGVSRGQDGELLVTAATIDYASPNGPFSKDTESGPANGLGAFTNRAPYKVNSVMGKWDIAAGEFTELEIPRAKVLPKSPTGEGGAGFSGYMIAGLERGLNIRLKSMEVVPQGLRWNAESGRYDFFGTLFDMRVSPGAPAQISAHGWTGNHTAEALSTEAFATISPKPVYCAYDAALGFSGGMVGDAAGSVYEASLNMFLHGKTLTRKLRYLQRRAANEADTYIRAPRPVFLYRNTFLPDDSDHAASVNFFLGEPDCGTGMIDDFLWTFVSDAVGARADFDEFISTYNRNPGLGRVAGLQVKYVEDGDYYKVRLFTDRRVPPVNSFFSVYNESLTNLMGGCVRTPWGDFGNGSWSFDDFIPDFELHEGDTAPCPITVNLHSEAISYFNN